MKHSSILKGKALLPNTSLKRVQIYFFLLTRQNVNLLFRISNELKKLILTF